MANALQRFDEYLNALGIPIDGISGRGPSCRIDFKAHATQQQRDTANAERLTFDWADQPDPNFKQFLIDVFNDGAIPAAARRDVSQMGLWFKLGEKQVALALWQLLSGGASATAIRQHALDNNVVLP